MSNLEQNAQCQHCGNKSPHVIALEFPASESVTLGEGQKTRSQKVNAWYYLTKCRTCNEVSLYWDCQLFDSPGSLDDAIALYPSEGYLESGVPNSVVETYSKAHKTKRVSKRAFVILIEKALELVCEDKHTQGNNLRKKVLDLKRVCAVPQTIILIAHEIKALRNVGAHESDFEITNQDVDDLEYLLKVILDHVYVVPKKLASLRNRPGKSPGGASA